MNDKLTQFIANLQGQFVEVSDRTNIYQCMDLAYLWVFCLGYPKATIQKLYAYQVYTQPTDLTRQYFDILENTATFIPQAGDIAVYAATSSNVAGHIGVCLAGATMTSFKCFEQNLPLGAPPSIKTRDYNTPRLLGVLRPKVNITTPEPVITEQTRIPQIDNLQVDQIRSERNDMKRDLSECKIQNQTLQNKITAAKTALG